MPKGLFASLPHKVTVATICCIGWHRSCHNAEIKTHPFRAMVVVVVEGCKTSEISIKIYFLP